jgi:hypothetical protein
MGRRSGWCDGRCRAFEARRRYWCLQPKSHRFLGRVGPQCPTDALAITRSTSYSSFSRGLLTGIAMCEFPAMPPAATIRGPIETTVGVTVAGTAGDKEGRRAIYALFVAGPCLTGHVHGRLAWPVVLGSALSIRAHEGTIWLPRPDSRPSCGKAPVQRAFEGLDVNAAPRATPPALQRHRDARHRGRGR